MSLLLLFGGGGGGGGGSPAVAGLTRLYDNLGSLIIRKIGDVGGAPSFRVSEELDNIIAWAGSAVRNIRRDTTTAENEGGGLDTLHTFSLDAPNQLATDGDYLRVEYGGHFAQNDDDKRLVASFGGSGYLDTGLRDVDGNLFSAGWKINATIIRLSSTSVRVNAVVQLQFHGADSAGTATGFGIGGYTLTFDSDLTGLSDLSANAMAMTVQGEGTSDGDVVQNLSIIELCQQ